MRPFCRELRNTAAPPTTALNADDVTIADIGKLTHLLRPAERAGTALPHIRQAIWVTEAGYNTKPPNPGGSPRRDRLARWVEQTLYLLWKQGESVVTWYLIRDSPPAPAYGVSDQTGMYYLNGRPTPAALAFRSRWWRMCHMGGRSSGSARQARARSRCRRGRGVLGAWSPRQHVSAFEVLEVTVPRGGRDFRAAIGGLTSLTWHL
jgi:hypothetical protein